jgi:RNA polymerase sigma-70 factor (ECF subfamily)
LREARAGSTDARGKIFESFRIALCARIRKLIVSPRFQAKASDLDLLQDTFLEAHRDFNLFTGNTRRQLATWLYRILGNNFGNFLRYYWTFANRLTPCH